MAREPKKPKTEKKVTRYTYDGHGVGTVSYFPHLPISKTQNQISYMRGELVELGKSDTVPKIVGINHFLSALGSACPLWYAPRNLGGVI